MNLCEFSIDPNQSWLFNVDEIDSAVMSDSFMLSSDANANPSRGNFDRSIVDEVWEAAEIIDGNDAALWRKDRNGNTICRSEYGNRYSSYGWEILEVSTGQCQAGDPGGLQAQHIDYF